jgi:ATP-binding protein involved in chromosome partitioning
MKAYSDLSAAGDGGSDILAQVLEQRRLVAQNLEPIRSILAVMSGKGGVGKSTVTVGLAHALTARGDSVAILDADLNGPSIPRLLGLHDRRPLLTRDGLVPPQTDSGIGCMSTDLFLGGDDEPLRYEGPADDAYTWRPTAEITTLRELLANTAWRRRDWLLLDLPPGADRLPNVLTLLPQLAGALVVTLGSALSLRSVRKSVTVARDHGVQIVGLVENMSGYACNDCHSLGPLFGPPEAALLAATAMRIPLLAAIPHDPGVTLALERGEPFDLSAGSPALRHALHELAARVSAFVTSQQQLDPGAQP